MEPFVPGHEYDIAEVRRILGVREEDGPFFIGRKAVAVMARLEGGGGADLPEPGVFRWPGEVPEGFMGEDLPMLLFLYRGAGSVRFAGTLSLEELEFSPDACEGPEAVTFELDPPLPRAAWLEIMGSRLPEGGPPPEEAIAALGESSGPAERRAALETFIGRWYGKKAPKAAGRRGAAPGPALLRWMDKVADAIPECFRHNELVSPEERETEDGRVVFLVENQAVCLWATEPAGEDPRVWYRNNDEGEPWIEEAERLSGFLVQAVLFEAILGSRFGASATGIAPDLREAILARADPLGLKSWNRGGARFLARRGALVMLMEHEGQCDVWLAAATPRALSPFEDLVDAGGWDRVAF